MTPSTAQLGWLNMLAQYSDAPGRSRIPSSASVNRLLDFFSAAKLFPMTKCGSGPGLRPHMQDAGRCGASDPEFFFPPQPAFCETRTAFLHPKPDSAVRLAPRSHLP